MGLLAGGLLALIYLLLLVGNPHDLQGKFSSYKMFPHATCDVIEFDNGLVTLKTCCGNSYFGDYMRRDNSWMWYHQSVRRRNPPEFKFKEPLEIQVEPHVFSITITFNDGKKLNLPRRVFTRIPL